MCRINIRNSVPKANLDQRYLADLAGRVLGMLGLEGCAVNIELMTSQKIRVLNRRYFGRDRATDVIAFPAGEDAFPEAGVDQEYLGDIAVSVDKARVNASAYSESFSRELARYVIHGLLHLSGERDSSEGLRKKMREKEDEILERTKDLVR